MMRVTTNYTTTKKWWAPLLPLLTFLLIAMPASAMDDLYQMSASTGTPYDMSGSTTIYSGTSTYYGYSSLRSIGFTFNFDGTDYTTFSVNLSGHMTLGKTAYYYGYYSYGWPERSSSLSPSICAYWGRYFRPYYYGSSSKIHYKVVGTAPRRVFVIEWYGMYGLSSSFRGLRYQARLYEGSNKIEFWYYGMSSTSSSTTYSGSIGIASSTSRYLSVYGNDFPREVYKNGNGPTSNYYRFYYDPIPDNTLWTFSPCDRQVGVVGDLAEGGTEDMENLDVLLEGKETLRGSSQTFRPFSLSVPDNGCDAVTYTASFTGPAAGDYAMPSGTIGLGETGVPELIFTPQAIGERSATLTLKLSTGGKLVYGLNATGLTRMDWMADVSQGGVDGMADGSALLQNIDVNRGETGDFTPFTLRNFNTDPSSKPAEVRYILEDPLNEYQISLGEESTHTELVDYVGGGESSTPVITFMPHAGGTYYGTGNQEARLTVIADGEERVFTLNGFGVAPAVEFSIENDNLFDIEHRFFRNVVTCVGEQSTTLRLDITNVNKVDVTLKQLDVYELDSRVQQGGPVYPLLENSWGGLVSAADYFIAENPGVAPTTANSIVKFPLTLKPGEHRTYYLTFVAQRPGKRYSRLFLQTDGVNFFGPSQENFMAGSTSENETEGLMVMEFFGRGVGSQMAKGANEDLDGLALTFDPVRVGESVESEATIYNTGECDLRISKDHLNLSTGDTKEFELLEVMSGIPVDNGDYVIPVGGSGTIKARFTPNRSGSRRASVMLKSNDSALIIDGITERGVYYLNLYGVGKADLRVSDLELSPAVIDGEGSQGYVHVENTSTEVIEINSLTLVGANVGEIAEDASQPWPSTPLRLDPGESLDLSVVLAPTTGSVSGLREAGLEIKYNGGDQVVAQIMGEAGTRELMVGPTVLFEGVVVPVGGIARRTAIISNSGTFPVEVNDIVIEGPGGVDYSVVELERRVIAAGGFEFVEVVYTPSGVGSSNAQLVVKSNATSGDVRVDLMGMGSVTEFMDPSSGSSLTQQIEAEGASRQLAGEGVLDLGQSVPNPGRGMVEIGYSVPSSGDVELRIYSATGEMVGELVSGEVAGGSHVVKVSTVGMESGVYWYRLRYNGKVLTRSMTVVN